MPRYYFDLRDEGGLVVDEEGINLPDLRAAQEGAFASIVDEVREMLRKPIRQTEIAIELRDESRLLMRVRLIIEIEERLQ